MNLLSRKTAALAALTGFAWIALASPVRPDNS